ncbi:MAG: hypothetical protein ACRCZI_05660, partial [Cetobacterium sp.]
MNRVKALRTYKFWCNPYLPIWKATSIIFCGMLTKKLFQMHENRRTSFHNLCEEKRPPEGVDKLLGNGLKFCIEKPLPKPNIEQTMGRLRNDIRRKVYWSKHPPMEDTTDTYNKKLYIPSKWNPEHAPKAVEAGLEDFSSSLKRKVQDNLIQRRRCHNLSTRSRKLLQMMEHNEDFIILPSDKNLGPAIMERKTYKRRCIKDHLSDEGTYRRLSQNEAAEHLQTAHASFYSLIQRNRKILPKSEYTFFLRAFEQSRRIPQFYCTPKVHKKPNWKTRPIVSCINSRMGDLSKWVDVQLQKVVHLCPGYLQDSHSLLTKFHNLGKLPKTAMLTTADATSMYTNIDTTHGINTLRNWFKIHEPDLPNNYPVTMILEATELVMRNNVFQFDDTYWLQLTGSAMGSSLACVYATIYYSFHEETYILPKYMHISCGSEILMPELQTPVPFSNTPPLLFHARLIDDAIQIWDLAQLPSNATRTFTGNLQAEMKFGILEWEAEYPSREKNFLDLTLKIGEDGIMGYKTYVKPQNLFLYIPMQS